MKENMTMEKNMIKKSRKRRGNLDEKGWSKCREDTMEKEKAGDRKLKGNREGKWRS